MSGLRPAAVLVLAVVLAGCAPGSREAAPFTGRWQSEGFGVYLVVEGGAVTVFEHTSVHCMPVRETTAAGIADAASIVDGRLVVEEAGRVVRYDPVEALPAACESPEEAGDARRNFEILAATFSEHAAFLGRRDPGTPSLESGANLGGGPRRRSPFFHGILSAFRRRCRDRRSPPSPATGSSEGAPAVSRRILRSEKGGATGRRRIRRFRSGPRD